MKQKTRDRYNLCRFFLTALALSFTIFACSQSITSESEKSSVRTSPKDDKILQIWWDKGFELEEDEAINLVIKNWEKKSGYKAKLSVYGPNELLDKAQRGVRSGNTPDLLLNFRAERQLNARLAWDGKLADVSDIIAPIKELYPESILRTAHLYNNVQKQRSYYAVPISQTTMLFFYWKDLLKQVGQSETSIPTEWNGFWEFWKKVQDDLRAKQNNIYGLGLPYSSASGDTYYFFEQLLEAYGVQIFDAQGQLLVRNPEVRQKIIYVLDWYAKFYQQGYVPPDAIKWLNPDNNRNLLNRHVVMTPNGTLSIPSAVSQDRDTYYKKLGTLKFPNKPNGQPMRYIVAIGHVILFANSKHQETAKDFLKYLIQPQILGTYLKSAERGHFPALKPVLKDPYWTNSADPHVSSVGKILTQGSIRPFDYVNNPAYTLVLDKNVWIKALNRIISDRLTPEQAADEAIVQIEEIVNKWN
ncbi:ABC transporter substrate-binding protein [Scytonema hofmannii PCC 7110]|uniref:ABC transporter substrate-binding protein n=1 Tax=Scytonema hofmannii PCC 7110 TaxID=128403 RepID=A0A139XEV8_9CYAN|nr:ABC transporter substrate-binding protein [Scytonema hofmannii]KYC43211.1 ABC transporter substrate-binding protein [Scytonema hofmannii PCC 7110]